MKTFPAKVTDEGVLIPREYLQPGDEFEAVVQNGDVLVRPKKSEPLPDVHERFPWIGIGETKDPSASSRVEEILEAELGRHSDMTDESSSSSELFPSESARFSFVGIARSKNPNASAEVEGILQDELGKRIIQSDEE